MRSLSKTISTDVANEILESHVDCAHMTLEMLSRIKSLITFVAIERLSSVNPHVYIQPFLPRKLLPTDVAGMISFFQPPTGSVFPFDPSVALLMSIEKFLRPEGHVTLFAFRHRDI